MPDAHALLQLVPDVMICYAADGTVLWASPSLERVYGFAPSDVVGTAFRLSMPAEHDTVDDAVAAALDDGSAVMRMQIRAAARDGSVRWADVVSTPSYREDGVLDYLVAVYHDVTDLVTAQQAVTASEARFRLMAENASDAVATADADGQVTWFSPSVTSLLGWRPEELVGQSVMDLLHPDDVPVVVAAQSRLAHGEALAFEARVRRSDGGYRWISSQVRAVVGEDGQLVNRVAGWRDIQDERVARQQLAFLAHNDTLTGLRNRAWILDILDTDLAVARRDGSPLAVFFLDLDNFKVVNDSLGHVAGDDILVEVARRISRALRPGDRIGRFGGDEFIVIAPGVRRRREAKALATRLSASVRNEVVLDGQPVTVSASVGIAISTPDSTSTSLLRDADAALFRAKAAGRARWEFADADMHARAMARLITETELRTAIAQQQFVVHYQPIVSLADGRVVGHEALVRWNHPERGLVAPMEFLPVAEESGLIVEIGTQVLDQVCTVLQTHPDVPGPISVNKSPLQMSGLGWHDRFVSRLRAHGIDPRRIIIEITETAILSIHGRTNDDLAHLRDLGIGIHIDDFGTGYSSIAMLRDLPVTGLKLDFSFTRHLCTDTTARALAAGLAGLAEGLKLDAIAEGIETPEQAAILRDQGWTHGQGYLYGRPAARPPEGLGALLGTDPPRQ